MEYRLLDAPYQGMDQAFKNTIPTGSLIVCPDPDKKLPAPKGGWLVSVKLNAGQVWQIGLFWKREAARFFADCLDVAELEHMRKHE